MSPAGIEAAAAESAPIHKALETAQRAHAGQIRNGSGGMAYIHHPIAVAELLAEHGFDETAIVAALLHDVVEDSEMSVADVEAGFGAPVAHLVAALTDEEEIEPYTRRKEAHRRKVEATGGDALAIYAADKLSNIRVLREAYVNEGEPAGEEFKAPLSEKEAVWEADLEMLRRAAPKLPFLADLAQELERLRQLRGDSAQRP